MLASSSTNSRGSALTRRYRTRAATSEVDETLFGNPKPMLPGRQGNQPSKPKEKPAKNQDGRTVQIITKDLIRNLRIPQTDPSGQSIILPLAEFERITVASKALEKEEREALMDAYNRKKEEEIKASEERKRQMHLADLSREENPVLTELELEARDQTQRLLERASALRMEQEEEIKQLNKLILSAQCQATRDAQIQDKKLIQAELLEEEKRLDAMMEVERRKALETIEQIDELRKQQRISGMQQVYDQIQQRMEEKQLQDELKEQERQQLRENQEMMNLEDLQALEKKRAEQQYLHEEVMRINAETMRAKERRREEEKLADMRDMEYIQKKTEREAEYEARQRKIKKDKELEIARLRAKQERAKDYKAEQDEIRARRNQEINDRKWRMKEKEQAEKKAQEEAKLRAARLEQVYHKEHLLSIEAGREKAQFDRVLKVQQETTLKQKEEEEKQHHKALRHSEALRQQMRERELSAIAKRREIFQEADQLTEKARQRRLRLDEIREKKLMELRSTGISEKYCGEVERKAKGCTLTT